MWIQTQSDTTYIGKQLSCFIPYSPLSTVPFSSLEKTSLLFEMIGKITSKNDDAACEGDCKYIFALFFACLGLQNIEERTRDAECSNQIVSVISCINNCDRTIDS